MSKGIGKRQRELLELLADGKWHEVARLTCPDAEYLSNQYPSHGASRPLVWPGTRWNIASSAKHKSTLRALRSLAERGLVEIVRGKNYGTGMPYEARLSLGELAKKILRAPQTA